MGINNRGQTLIGTVAAIVLMGYLVFLITGLGQKVNEVSERSNDSNEVATLLDNLTDKVKSTPYKEIPNKWNNASCTDLDGKYCFTSKPDVNDYYSNVELKIYENKDKSKPVVESNVSKAYIYSFSPPKVHVALHADDHFTGSITTDDKADNGRKIGSEAYYDNWEPLWQFDQLLYDNVDTQYVHIHAWNNNGSGWGNCGLNMQVTLDKPYYRFPNGKQYIDTRTGWQYFHLRTDGFGGADKPIKHGAWHSYGPGTIWREDAIVAHIWVSLPIYLNTSSVEL